MNRMHRFKRGGTRRFPNLVLLQRAAVCLAKESLLRWGALIFTALFPILKWKYLACEPLWEFEIQLDHVLVSNLIFHGPIKLNLFSYDATGRRRKGVRAVILAMCELLSLLKRWENGLPHWRIDKLLYYVTYALCFLIKTLVSSVPRVLEVLLDFLDVYCLLQFFRSLEVHQSGAPFDALD